MEVSDILQGMLNPKTCSYGSKARFCSWGTMSKLGFILKELLLRIKQYNENQRSEAEIDFLVHKNKVASWSHKSRRFIITKTRVND